MDEVGGVRVVMVRGVGESGEVKGGFVSTFKQITVLLH